MEISMRKSVAVMLVLVFLVASCLVVAKPAFSSVEDAEDSWVSKAPMHEARSGLGVAVVNGKIYAIGGVNSSGFVPSSPGSAVYAGTTPVTVTSTNEEYDPATDTWVTKAAMPNPRAVFAIAVYQNKIYCIGGKTNDSYTAINEVYNPSTNTWETKTPLPAARAFLRANVVNGKIYLIGGSPNGSLNEVYDPETDSWNTKASSPSPTIFGFATAASAVLDSKIYFIGGLSADQHYNLNQIYDTKTDSWSFGSSPPTSVDGGAAIATTGVMAPKRIYVIGNPSNLRQGEEQTYVRVYDPNRDSWTFGADIITRRYNFGVAIVNDMMYVIGGHTYFWLEGTYTPVAVNEQYTPIGYGTPDPSPSPTPSLSPTPTPSPSSTPSQEPSPSPIPSQESSPSPEPQQPEPFPTVPVAAVSTASAVAVSAGLIVYFKKRKH
jgi:hypothetical protein